MKTVFSETPAAAATSATVTWSKPRVTNSRIAAFGDQLPRLELLGLAQTHGDSRTHDCYSCRNISVSVSSRADHAHGKGDRLLARLAHVVISPPLVVIGVWIVLTLFGAFAAGQVSKRWYQSFSIPGKSAYEANQRTLKAFGVGVRPPNVVVFHTSGDATKSEAIRAAMQRAAKANPGALTSSYFSTRQPRVTSRSDRHTTFMEIYPPGLAKFDTKSGADADARRPRPPGCRPGSTVNVTGHDPLEEASDARRRAAARASCSRP